MFIRGPVLILMLLFCGLVSGCADQTYQTSSGSVVVQPSITLGYSPPIVPLEITFNPVTMHVGLEIDGKIQIPVVGTFSVTGALSTGEPTSAITRPVVTQIEPTNQNTGGARFLIVKLGKKTKTYALKKGVSYKIIIPSDENNRSFIQWTGDDKDILVSIPNPASETIASLQRTNATLREANATLKAQEVSAKPQRRYADQNSGDQSASDDSVEYYSDAPIEASNQYSVDETVTTETVIITEANNDNPDKDNDQDCGCSGNNDP